MDGIARNTAGFEHGLADALVPVALAAVVVLGVLLAMAVAVEVLRHQGRAAGIVRRLDRITPSPARHLAAATLSLVVALAAPATAYASDAPVRDWLAGSTTTTSPVATEDALIERSTLPPAPVPDPAPVPAAPAPAAPLPIAPPPPSAAPPLDTVMVVEGDCLWSIAARRLAPDVGNAVIDAAWRAIYALNRAAIGDDPNLIFPGAQLALPPIDPSPHTAP